MTEAGRVEAPGSTTAPASRPDSLLQPGEVVEYDGEAWEVWAFDSDGTVGLVRRALGTRPHFVKVRPDRLSRRQGSSAA
jgi:hypothetical protein